MKRVSIAIMLILSLMLIGGCGLQLKSGSVISKKFTPAHTYSYTTFYRIGKALIPRTNVRYVPDDYQLLVQGITENEKAVQEWWGVTASLYESVDVGSTLTREE